MRNAGILLLLSSFGCSNATPSETRANTVNADLDFQHSCELPSRASARLTAIPWETLAGEQERQRCAADARCEAWTGTIDFDDDGAEPPVSVELITQIAQEIGSRTDSTVGEVLELSLRASTRVVGLGTAYSPESTANAEARLALEGGPSRCAEEAGACVEREEHRLTSHTMALLETSDGRFVDRFERTPRQNSRGEYIPTGPTYLRSFSDAAGPTTFEESSMPRVILLERGTRNDVAVIAHLGSSSFANGRERTVESRFEARAGENAIRWSAEFCDPQAFGSAEKLALFARDVAIDALNPAPHPDETRDEWITTEP